MAEASPFIAPVNIASVRLDVLLRDDHGLAITQKRTAATAVGILVRNQPAGSVNTERNQPKPKLATRSRGMTHRLANYCHDGYNNDSCYERSREQKGGN